MIKIASLPAVALTLVACGGVTDDPYATGETEQPLYCSSLSCGGNSPTADNLEFNELDETGVLPSGPGGLRIAKFETSTGIPLKVRVVGRRLTGIGPLGGIAAGPALLNARLFVTTKASATHWYRIRIAGIGSVPFWDEGSGQTIETYDMVINSEPKPGFGGNTGLEKKLCPKLGPSSEPGPVGHDVVVFKGERYSRTNGDLVASGAAVGDWFNIGCAGDAFSKVLAIRHSAAAQDATHLTSPHAREAAFRMFRADYCGDGVAYTEFGTPLELGNAGGWVEPTGVLDTSNVEAIWDQNGAVCLNRPRHVAEEDKDEVISCSSELEACTQAQIDSWASHGHVISVNP